MTMRNHLIRPKQTKVMNPELPTETLIDIFSRLPSESMRRCRCLSKEWSRLLSEPWFIKEHIAQKPLEKNIFLFSHPYIHIITATEKDTYLSRTLRFATRVVSVIDSCEGLVLFRADSDALLVVNLTTQQQVVIPDAPPEYSNSNRKYKMVCGFGHDCSTGDYKIVLVNGHDMAMVFSLKMGVWKRVKSPHGVAYLTHGVFVNGACNWMAWRPYNYHENFIVAFDIVVEAFSEIRLPIGVEFECGYIVKLLGCLACYDVRAPYPMKLDLWIMKAYGVTESWTKLVVETKGLCYPMPLCSIGHEQDIILRALRHELVRESVVYQYNQTEKTLSKIFDYTSSVVQGGTFAESLVSPPTFGDTGRKSQLLISKVSFLLARDEDTYKEDHRIGG